MRRKLSLWLCGILAALFVLGFSACTPEEQPGKDPTSEPPAAQVPEAPVEEPEPAPDDEETVGTEPRLDGDTYRY